MYCRYSAQTKSIPLKTIEFQTNSGEQFFLFSSLAAWLVRKTGKRFDPPQEFDDPNSVIASILDQVRQLGIAVDFAPSKLKAGYGEHALFVLDTLCDAALQAVKFEWCVPVPPREDTGLLQDEMEEDAEVDIEKVEEDMAGVYSEEEEADIVHIDTLGSAAAGREAGEAGTGRRGGILQTTGGGEAAEQWRLEVERVTPQLRMTVKTEGRDWRSHLEQMHQYRDGIGSKNNIIDIL